MQYTRSSSVEGRPRPKASRRRVGQSLAVLGFCCVMAVVLAACAGQKNTAKTRFWKSFTAKYNTYYNGSLAFIDGNEEKEKSNQDNFTELLPLYPVANKQSREIGKANYDRAIEKMEKTIKLHSIKQKPEWNKTRRKTDKDKEWLSRKEYNPFLYKAWLMLGKAQFQSGRFDEAAATFSYVSRLYQSQPAISQLAKAWLAKSYMQLDWMYDAEDVLRNQQRDSMHYRVVKDWDYTYADYYLHTLDYDHAIPYLRKVIKHERRRVQRAREWFILGQIYAATGQRELAYKAFGKVPGQNPPYILEFNARIAQTEVMAAQDSKRMIARLRRMAASDNNKDYLDQVYYAIGNIYLSQQDTVKAIQAYEEGNTKATRSGIEKGVLLLTLGGLYWEQEKYNDAQRCYGEAIGLLDQDRPDYPQLSQRSKVLDELVPYTDAVYLQDSLQLLAKMPEDERLAAIDRVIDALKKKEKEERDKAREAEVAEALKNQPGANGRNPRAQTGPQASMTGGVGQGSQWYFYNQMAVNQGKQTFQRQWGKRENTDHWQRINRTVVDLMADNTPADTPDDELSDSLLAEGNAMPEGADSLMTAGKEEGDTLANDPHNREYYLAQIPFTTEQLEASDAIIMDGLLHSGIIFKDKLDNLALSEKQLLRLTKQYADYELNDQAWYHLFLLYSRQGKHDIAANCLSHLSTDWPESEYTVLLNDPYYADNARFGEQIEDSLYAATYTAFRADRFGEVELNDSLAAKRFPLGEHRAKFIFVDGLAQLNQGRISDCLDLMRQVVENHPQSEVAEMAGMIVKGVQEGRQLHGGSFDLGDIWSRRDLTLAADSTNTDTLSAERNTNFVFILAYQIDSLTNAQGLTAASNENQLLFEMARYNFTNFLVRNFDITIDRSQGISRMTVSGFLSFDEALQYARKLYQEATPAAAPQLAALLACCRSIVISEQNLALIGLRYSYNDYDLFYEQHFLPLTISNEELLNIPTDMPEQPDEDTTPSSDAPQPASQRKAPDPDLDFFDDLF